MLTKLARGSIHSDRTGGGILGEGMCWCGEKVEIVLW